MSLIVETGLNVTGADSYISEADAILRAVTLGLPFPATDAESEIPLRQAATYLEKFRNNYQGSKVFTGQSLQWPRDPVYIDNVLNDLGMKLCHIIKDKRSYHDMLRGNDYLK